MTALATPEEQVPKTTSHLSSRTNFLKAITPFSGLYSVFPKKSSTFWPMIPPCALISATAILAAFNWSSPEGVLKGARTPILMVLAMAKPDVRKKQTAKTAPIPIAHLFVFICHLLFLMWTTSVLDFSSGVILTPYPGRPYGSQDLPADLCPALFCLRPLLPPTGQNGL